METNKKLLTIDIKKELFDELEILAKEMETSKGGIIRLAVKEYLKNKKTK